MADDQQDPPTHRGSSRQPAEREPPGPTGPNETSETTRRRLLASATGLFAAVAGCTFSVNSDGVALERDGSDSTTRTRTTATTTRTTARQSATTQPTETQQSTVTRTTETQEPTTTQPTETQQPAVTRTAVTTTPELVVYTPVYVQRTYELVPGPTLETPGDTVDLSTTTTRRATTTARQRRRFRVDNFYLYVASADDGALNRPNTEEIYGDIYVAGGYDDTGVTHPARGSDRGYVWSRSADEAIEIEEGSGRRIRPTVSDVVVDFDRLDEFGSPQAYVTVFAILSERDSGVNPDDVLGGQRLVWYIDAEPSPSNYVRVNGESYFKTVFTDGGTEVRLSFDITPV